LNGVHAGFSIFREVLALSPRLACEHSYRIRRAFFSRGMELRIKRRGRTTQDVIVAHLPDRSDGCEPCLKQAAGDRHMQRLSKINTYYFLLDVRTLNELRWL
jgi:hypothetical protein